MQWGTLCGIERQPGKVTVLAEQKMLAVAMTMRYFGVSQNEGLMLDGEGRPRKRVPPQPKVQNQKAAGNHELHASDHPAAFLRYKLNLGRRVNSNVP